MKKQLLAVALLALFGLTFCHKHSEDHYKKHFGDFIKKYGKTYKHDDFHLRYKIFKDNFDLVENHNEKNLSYKMALNHLGDLTHSEFKSLLLGAKFPTELYHSSNSKLFVGNVTDIPKNFDWRDKGAVTPVKDQGQCGSCYSFSTTGSVEGCHFLATGQLVSLSEQNIIDCSWIQGNQGCNGGLMTSSMDYIIANQGIDTEESYPYTAIAKKRCGFQKANVGATLKSYSNIASGSETDLLQAIVKAPVSVAIDASRPSFQFYSSGVYFDDDCSSTSLDHGVLLVGWGIEGDNEYWLVKNSWSSNWGDAGYIKMARNKNNHCGIATMATIPQC
eukprot:TRINITY_DN55435_c0_g1_i1.p1 TRINITY_DN55435_c0_g1~~TRINITY_DN55435_c0_g1_i1.p1  ORF type:complete len:332 (-),score=102.99 TRINITY_DN55435_c0_g1_i1:79-1074(-)